LGSCGSLDVTPRALQVAGKKPYCAVVDRIIDHLNLTFVAERPPPPNIACQEVLMAAEASTE